MLRILHLCVVWAYAIAPPLALMLAVARLLRRRQGSANRRGGRFTFTISAAIILGSAVSLVYAVALGGHIGIDQVLLSIYLTASLMFLLGAFDAVLVSGLKWVWGFVQSGDPHRAADPDDHAKPVTAGRKFVESLPFLIRAAVLIAVALPYLMASALTYRPKIVPRITPSSQLGYDFEPVSFETSDGLTIAAWWIPAPRELRPQARRSTDSAPPRGFGRETVILCHGIASGKAGVLNIARPLLQHGYNVLAFDFRAHGESDGQLTSLGNLEREDVLAAVRWLQENKARQSRRILGVGVSTGAAALIAAAADPSPQGQAIEALAVYEGFDDLSSLGRTVARTRFLPPLSWVADRVGLALASAQVGADLVHFSPAEQAKTLWPRPIFFIHGGADQVIPFERGEALFDHATEPKRRLWLPTEDYGQSINDKGAAREVRDFLDEARPVPAI
jgi:alpha-beta hydrolase superfamily lysophospholipase